MYHAIVRYRARKGFQNLNDGDFAALLGDVADDVHHIFAGEHPLGGERHGKEALGRWFGRLHRLFPDLRLEVREVIAKGWPWRTVVAIEWVARATLENGDRYFNTGAHILRLRWGRAVYIHAHEDSQRVADACRRLASSGVEEAAAAPITN